MKILKLNKRYLLGREGFSHALVFTMHNDKYLKKKAVVEKLLHDMYGQGAFYYKPGHAYYDRHERPKWAKYTQTRNTAGVMQWFIGLKEESMLSVILLMVD